MQNKFQKHFASLQQLFTYLNEKGKLNAKEVEQFNTIQRGFVEIYNYHYASNEVALPWTDEDFVATWNRYKDYRKQQHKFKFVPISEKAALDRLIELSGNNKDSAIKHINFAIANTWQGIFPMNEKNSSSPKGKEVKKESSYD